MRWSVCTPDTPKSKFSVIVCRVSLTSAVLSLEPLGSDYCGVLEAGMNNGWCDRYPNQGKQSGAFSAGTFDGDPYILMNYQPEVLDHVLPPNGALPTEVQKRLFGKPPAPGIDARAAAREVARSLARKAYRRPASDAELDVLLGVFVNVLKYERRIPKDSRRT